MDDPNLLKEMNDLLPTSTKALLFNPAANEVGKGVGAVCSIVFSPLIELNILEKKVLAHFTNKIARKIERIPKDKLDFSKPGLVLKALEESRYQLNEEILQDMFANLIAAGVNRNKNNNITPRYATVLSQISPEDASFLQDLFNQEYPAFPISKFQFSSFIGRNYRELPGIYFCNQNEEIKKLPERSVDVLQSLGVIQQEFNRTIAEEPFTNLYNLLDNYLMTKNQSKNVDENYLPKVIPGLIHPTAFGDHLLNCIF